MKNNQKTKDGIVLRDILCFLIDIEFYNNNSIRKFRIISIFETKYRFKWWALAFQLDIDITFAERLKAEIW